VLNRIVGAKNPQLLIAKPLPTSWKKCQRSVKHIWFLPTLKPNAEKPKELALSQPTTIQRIFTLNNSELLLYLTWNNQIGFQMNRIKEVLKDKGISQTWLSKQTGKSYTTINEYARNVRQPSLEDLYQIAEILQVSAKDLLIDKTELKWVKKKKTSIFLSANCWTVLK